MTYNDFTFESLGEGIEICISDEHRFGTDAFLLADFSAGRHKDICADLCTGSGIIALLLHKFYKPQKIYAVEIQEKAHEQLKVSKNDSEAVSIARHEMLCTIDDVCRCAKKNLKFGGRLCICNRPERLCDIMTAMRANGIEPKRLRTVHKNPECPPWLILVEGKKGGKPFVQIEKPLYVRSADGGNSAEMKRIYGLE